MRVVSPRGVIGFVTAVACLKKGYICLLQIRFRTVCLNGRNELFCIMYLACDMQSLLPKFMYRETCFQSRPRDCRKITTIAGYASRGQSA